ncbi:hypothetical protein [Actinoplanes sp. NPDC020271]|uniref:baeRF10 domain-containing protein n=1 Tax=Actinoplanes sp. NPDC020271 TaxID=3363896 RepID=UPI00378968C1
MSVIRAEDLHDIARLADPAGVLSVYATVDPHPETAVPAPWQVRIPHLLTELTRRAGTELPHLRQRIDAIQPALTRMLDGKSPGRGHALFATVSGETVREVHVQTSLENGVRLGDAAYLRPLADAFSKAAPAGIVAVSRHGIRLIDYRLGLAEEAGTLVFEPPAPPRTPGRSGTQRDLQNRRTIVHLERFLADSGARLAQLGAHPDWEQLVVTGDGDLVAAFVAGLPRLPHTDVVTAGHVVTATMPPSRVATLVAVNLDVARQRARLRFAELVRDTAHAGGAATAGPADTLHAAARGRVRHLLLDGARHPAGIDGPGDETGEQLIELTYGSGGAVTLLGGGAARVLAHDGGVAALLHP